MTAEELWQELHRKMSPKEGKEANKMLKEWHNIYKGLQERALNPVAQDIMKQGENDQDGFLCFLIGRSAPTMWDNFIVRHPFEPNKEVEQYLDKCSELFFKDGTVHFVSQYYGLALLFFQVGAYMGSVEEGKCERAKVRSFVCHLNLLLLFLLIVVSCTSLPDEEVSTSTRSTYEKDSTTKVEIKVDTTWTDTIHFSY